MLAAVKGYKSIITMQDKNSLEKKFILNSMGAECIRTPTDAPYYKPESHIGVAFKLRDEIENARFLDQYSDDSNALVNYDETAEELWQDMDGKCDYVVLTVGTGGTITGIARKFKERNPNCIIVGVDPIGSSMAMPKLLNNSKCPFKVEGIGYDFVPKNLDQESVDIWYKTEDRDSFLMARRIIRDEGILVGGSSGSVLWAALEVARGLPADKRVCVLFCDSIRNYMSKFISDDWMIEHNYIKEDDVEKTDLRFGLNILFGKDYRISQMIEVLKIKRVKLFNDSMTIEEVFEEMDENNLDYVKKY
jgi:cystathionine beta-synthase